MNQILFEIANNLFEKKAASILNKWKFENNYDHSNSSKIERLHSKEKRSRIQAMASAPVPATPFRKMSYTNGDCSFEWQTLLNTPCYGFNGPNACYSSTCKHDGSKSTTTATKSQHLTGQKSAAPNLSVKFNWRTLYGRGGSSDSSNDSAEHVLATVTTGIVNDSPKVNASLAEQMNTGERSNGIVPKFSG